MALTSVVIGDPYSTSNAIPDSGVEAWKGRVATHLGDGAVPALTLSAYAAMEGRTTVWS